MVDDEDLVKILDFGIAHVAESNVTVSGVMVGTPNYMAPEQVTGGRIDRRTDVFAVGSVFYELLSYQRAFSGDLITSVHRIVYEEPAPLARLVPSLDPRLIRIVERALAKDPDQRYSTLRSMAAEINAARQSLDGTLAAPTGIATPSPTAFHSPSPARVGSPTTLQLSTAARARSRDSSAARVACRTAPGSGRRRRRVRTRRVPTCDTCRAGGRAVSRCRRRSVRGGPASGKRAGSDVNDSAALIRRRGTSADAPCSNAVDVRAARVRAAHAD